MSSRPPDTTSVSGVAVRVDTQFIAVASTFATNVVAAFLMVTAFAAVMRGAAVAAAIGATTAGAGTAVDMVEDIAPPAPLGTAPARVAPVPDWAASVAAARAVVSWPGCAGRLASARLAGTASGAAVDAAEWCGSAPALAGLLSAAAAGRATDTGRVAADFGNLTGDPGREEAGDVPLELTDASLPEFSADAIPGVRGSISDNPRPKATAPIRAPDVKEFTAHRLILSHPHLGDLCLKSP